MKGFTVTSICSVLSRGGGGKEALTTMHNVEDEESISTPVVFIFFIPAPIMLYISFQTRQQFNGAILIFYLLKGFQQLRFQKKKFSLNV